MTRKKLIRLAQVEEITGFKRSYLYFLIQQEKFIKPVKIGRSSRWPLDAVLDWVEQRIAERDAVSQFA